MKIIIRYGFLVLMTLTLAVAPLNAATITVDADHGAEDGGDGECSINDAIKMANTNFVNTECAITGTLGAVDTIVLTKDVTIEQTDQQVPYTNNGFNATMSITTGIIIEGNNFTLSSGQTCTIDGINTGEEFRLLYVGAEGDLTIKNLTLEDGCADRDNTSEDDGGAIYNLGTLTIENSVLQTNKSKGEGGAIYNAAGAELTISNQSTLDQNEATNSGGAVSNRGTIDEISNSTFSQNSTSADEGGGHGGAVFHSGEALITLISGTTFSDNLASNDDGNAEGGALYAAAPITDIVNNTFSGNEVKRIGQQGFAQFGAAISLRAVIAKVENNTFSANEAGVDSGIAHNSGSIGSFKNNLFSGGSSNHCVSVSQISTNAAKNLTNSPQCPGNTGTTVTNFDTNLADNGGPTLTHALNEGSNAIDDGDNGVCPDTDQRGWLRRDSDCDIGAFEFGAVPPGAGGAGRDILLLLDSNGGQ